MTTIAPTPRANGVEPTPYIMTSPYVSLSCDGTEHEIHCLMSHVELNPDTDSQDITTFCGSKSYPGNVTWHFIATFYQSFDDGGTDSLLCCIWDAYQNDGTLPEFVIRPYRDRAVGPNNPEFKGQLVPSAYALIAGDAGQASTIDIDWTLNAWPERDPECGEAARRGTLAQTGSA